MDELFLIIFFPITAILAWFLIRRISRKPGTRLLLMALGLTLIQVSLFTISSLTASGSFQLWHVLTFSYLLCYIPCMLIMFVFFLILRMMRDSSENS